MINRLHTPRPPPGPQKAFGRQLDMVFTKTMGPAIHRTTDVKFAVSCYHPGAN